MSEYIERGALIAFVRGVRKNLPKDSKDFFTRDEMLLNFQQYLELQKAADVEPVVRGEWFLLDDCANAGVYCSACKRAVFKESAWYKNVHIKSKYCPNCGAHMERSGSGE